MLLESRAEDRQWNRVRRSAFSGVLWTATSSWSVQAINLLVFILLARLLDASDFGLIAMAGVFVVVTGVLADQGIPTAIIQRKDIEPLHVDTAFWLSVLLGAILTIAGVAMAGPVSRFYGEPELARVVSLLAFTFLVQSFGGVQQALLARRFDFGRLAVRSFGAAVVGGAVAVTLAMNGYGVMALVAQQLSTSLAGVLLLWRVGGWRPQIRFSVRHARELLSFGVGIVGIRLLDAVSKRADDLLIGVFLGSVLLGYYAVAYKLLKVMGMMLSKVVSRVALPAFSQLQESPAELRRALCQSITVAGTISFPVFAGIGILSPVIVPAVFGPQWAPSIPVMQVLVFMGALQAVQMLMTQLIIAAGKPSWILPPLVGSTVLTVLAFAIALQWGIVAVAVAYTVVGYLMLPVHFILLRRLIGLRLAELLAAVRTPLLVSAASASVLIAMEYLLHVYLEPLPRLLVCVSVGAAACILAVAALEPSLLRSLGRVVQKKRRSHSRKADPSAR